MMRTHVHVGRSGSITMASGVRIGYISAASSTEYCIALCKATNANVDILVSALWPAGVLKNATVLPVGCVWFSMASCVLLPLFIVVFVC